MLDTFGYLLYGLIFLGLFLIARKNKFGWICRIVGELGWAVIGWQIGMSSIWVCGVIFAMIDMYGFIKWSKEGHSARS